MGLHLVLLDIGVLPRKRAIVWFYGRMLVWCFRFGMCQLLTCAVLHLITENQVWRLVSCRAHLYLAQCRSRTSGSKSIGVAKRGVMLGVTVLDQIHGVVVWVHH